MNEQLIDYLYGEMTTTQRADFEAQLANNPTLKAELDELQFTRRLLSDVQQVRPSNTTVTIRATPTIPMSSIKWMAVAASVIAFVWATQPRIQFQNTGAVIVFGNYNVADDERIFQRTPTTDCAPMIEAAIADSNAEIFELLDSIQKQLGRQMDWKEKALMAALEDELNGYQKKQQQNLVRAVSNQYQQNIPRIVTNFQDMSLEQRQEIRLLLKQLWEELQAQREKDLEYVERAIILLQEEQLHQQKTINDLIRLVNH